MAKKKPVKIKPFKESMTACMKEDDAAFNRWWRLLVPHIKGRGRAKAGDKDRVAELRIVAHLAWRAGKRDLADMF